MAAAGWRTAHGSPEAGGGAGVAATASGGEDQLGETAGGVVRRGEASARVGSGGAEAGVARGNVLSGAEMAGAAHMAGQWRQRAAEEKQRREREREVDEGGPECNFREMQGPYCNASIAFKPVLKWR
jgi:hypothetical protein